MTVKKTMIMLMVAGAVLCGCYRPVEVMWHAHHQYKGRHDPLLEKVKNGDFRARLAERFRQVQTDR